MNKNIALIAHDRRKLDLLDWVKYNADVLLKNTLICTGTTGKLVEKALINHIDQEFFLIDNSVQRPRLDLIKVNSGPLGGDAQIAAMVVDKQVDLCIFLIDDLTANPHEADIQMLLRQCRIHNIPVACNRSTADFLLSSALWLTDYEPLTPKYVDLIY